MALCTGLDAKLIALRRSVNRGSPFGDETWATTATKKLGLEMTNLPQGTPRIKKTVPDTFFCPSQIDVVNGFGATDGETGRWILNLVATAVNDIRLGPIDTNVPAP